jgi:ABC-type transporter Mla subunit MlaD
MIRQITKVEDLQRFCKTIGNLPSSYVDSLSYQEQLNYLCHYIVDKVSPALKEQTEAIIEIKNYVDEYLTDIDVVKEQIAQLITDVNTLNNEVETNTENIAELNTKIDNEISSLKAYLEDMINENFNSLKLYVDTQDSILDEKINNIQIGAISVYNPTTGTLDPLQTVINDLYEMTNKDGLTASEFDGLELTASKFDSYEITAKEFDSEGKLILV